MIADVEAIRSVLSSAPNALKRFNITMYVLEHTDPATKILKTTYYRVAKDTNVDRITVIRMFDDLEAKGCITPAGKNEWKVNLPILQPNEDDDSDGVVKFVFSRCAAAV